MEKVREGGMKIISGWAAFWLTLENGIAPWKPEFREAYKRYYADVLRANTCA